MLESGQVKYLEEIAAREGVGNSYVSRMVNLTSLASDILEAILDYSLIRQDDALYNIAVDTPALWAVQGAAKLNPQLIVDQPDLQLRSRQYSAVFFRKSAQIDILTIRPPPKTAWSK